MELESIGNQEKLVKINLGSGQRPFGEGWLNLDIRKQEYPVDIIADAKFLPMFEDNSVDVLVAHHLFEHIGLNDQEEYLSEWYRVLKPGGKLLISVPDLREIDRAWLEGKISTFIHNVNTYGAFQGYITDLHRWGYDKQELVDRVYAYNQERTEAKFPWKFVQFYHSTDEIWEGSDIASDWWILILIFTK